MKEETIYDNKKNFVLLQEALPGTGSGTEEWSNMNKILGANHAPTTIVKKISNTTTKHKSTMATHSEGEENICTNCGTTKSPLWRRDNSAERNLLCNKCGLYYKRHQAPRPLKVAKGRKPKRKSEKTKSTRKTTRRDSIVEVTNHSMPLNNGVPQQFHPIDNMNTNMNTNTLYMETPQMTINTLKTAPEFKMPLNTPQYNTYTTVMNPVFQNMNMLPAFRRPEDVSNLMINGNMAQSPQFMDGNFTPDLLKSAPGDVMSMSPFSYVNHQSILNSPVTPLYGGTNHYEGNGFF